MTYTKSEQGRIDALHRQLVRQRDVTGRLSSDLGINGRPNGPVTEIRKLLDQAVTIAEHISSAVNSDG